MFKRIILGMSMLFPACACCAQSVVMDVKVPGEIIYDNDTAHVSFDMIYVMGGFALEYIQRKIRYTDADGKRRKIRPADAKEIHFSWDQGIDVRMVSIKPVRQARKKKFVHLVIEGRVRYYEYFRSYRQGRFRTTTIYPFYERDGVVTAPKLIGFRKQMKKYFKDCPQLVNLIDTKVLRHDDVQEIVRYYNDSCR